MADTVILAPEMLEHPAVQRLLGRSALYELLALSLVYPDDDTVAQVEELVEDLRAHPVVVDRRLEAALQRLSSAARDVDAERLAPVHFALFEGSVLCSPHETEYIRNPLAKAAQLADIAGFYAAFGLRVSRLHQTTPDEIGTLAFDGCRVPKGNLIGAPGEGMKVALATLDVFRSTVGAAALGFARRALDETLGHVRRREVFGGRLADLPVVQQKLAAMAVEVEASALMVYRAAWTKDAGAARVTKEAAMAKAYATEAAQRVIDTAVQLHGGLGVTVGAVVERLYRDVRPLRIYEGATEIQHLVIARQLLKESEPRTTDN